MAETIPVLLVVSLIVFMLMRLLPGDPIEAFLGEEGGNLSVEQRAQIEKNLGLDKPLPIQYVDWVTGLVTGDWGTDTYRQSVAKTVGERFTATAQLATLAWVLGLAIGVPLGVISALRRNSWTDVGITTVSLAGLATPNFLLAILLILIFSVSLGWLPSFGFVSIIDDPVEGLKRMALPVVALSTGLMAAIVRQTRSGVLEVMAEDYVRTAAAKGLSRSRLIIKHVLKNALLPVVTVAGIQIGNLVSGTIIVETMFAIPGIGSLTLRSILIRDFQTIQVLVVIIAVFTVMANLLADIAYVFLDPRIRLS
ncbi:MAG: ABC transporter permease [Dehalococcoidia bacterium]|nr:ABC transporter permease [Dehalococcoidia bacterium]